MSSTFLDGGALLPRVPWTKGSTYAEICSQYVAILRKYGQTVIVFDGYVAGPATKDNTHLCRSSKQSHSADVKVTKDIEVDHEEGVPVEKVE